MIWIRRTISVLLGIVLLPLLFASLVTLRLNDTFLNSGFYPDLLEKEGVYRFVMVDVLTSALDEARELDPGKLGAGFDESPLVTSGLTTPQIVDAVNRALPPGDLEEMVAPVALRVGEYIGAERGDLTVTVQVGGRAEAMARELKGLMREAGTYGLLLDRELEPRIREAVGEALAANEDVSHWARYLFGSPKDAADRLIRAGRRIVTPEWLQAQVERALGEVTPYLAGESDSFEIRVRLTDEQAAAAVDETKSILREVDAYDLVYTDLVEPAVRDSLEEAVLLPYGVEITRDEVMDVLRQAAPPTWVRQQAEIVIDDVAPYLVGRSDGFSTAVSLVDNKRQAEGAIAELAFAKLTEAVLALPVCPTRAESLAAAESLGHGLPACIPLGASATDVIERAGPEVAGSISPLVLANVPNRVRFTDSNLRWSVRQTGGQGALDLLDDGRELLSEGWTYASAELHADLAESGGDAVETLAEIRAFLADGYAYTHEHGSGDRRGNPVVRDLDTIHGLAMIVRRYGWIAYVLTPVLLITIGLLGGRSWPGRVAWASLFLLISAGAAFITPGLLYDAYFAPELDRAHADIAPQPSDDFGSTLLLIADKARGISESAGVEFVGGIRKASFVLALGASAALLSAIFWARIAAAIQGLLRRR